LSCPSLARAAVIGNTTDPANAQALRETERAAGALAVKLKYVEIRERFVKPKIPLYNGIDQGNDATSSDENLQHNSLSNPPPRSTFP